MSCIEAAPASPEADRVGQSWRAALTLLTELEWISFAEQRWVNSG